MIRILVADDEPLVRAGLRTILESDPELRVVADAADGAAAVTACDAHRPDVALLDIQMPGTDGLEAARSIRARHAGVRIIIVTTFDDDAYLARALELGVDGFLLKSADPFELIAGVKATLRGGAALSPRVARRLLSTLPPGNLRRRLAARNGLAALTGRERQVLALLGTGLTNAQIAARLHLAEGTVKLHVSAVLGKLQVGNRVQAAVLAYDAGLCDPWPG